MDKYFKVVEIKKSKTKNNVQPNLFWSQENYDRKLENFKIHLKIAQKIKNLVYGINPQQEDSKNVMNLFLQGPSGSGKYTLARFCTYLYTDIENPCLNLDTIKFESKELEYYRGSKLCELIIYKYNFNDLNLIRLFFETVCHSNENYNIGNKKIIIIKNIQNIRKENLYLFKYFLEKYSLGNAFIMTSTQGIPVEFKGFTTILRVPSPTEEELNDLGKGILKSKKIKTKNADLKKIIKQSGRNMVNFINLLEISYSTGKFNLVEETDKSKFMFLYKLIKKQNLKSVILIRELLVELLTENVKSQEILKFLLDRFLNSKNVLDSQKDKIVKIISHADIQDSMSLRNVIHLESACLQIMNLFE